MGIHLLLFFFAYASGTYRKFKEKLASQNPSALGTKVSLLYVIILNFVYSPASNIFL